MIALYYSKKHLIIAKGFCYVRSAIYYVKLKALVHIDELSKVAVAQRKEDGNIKIEPDKKNHPFAKDGFNYRTAFFLDDGQYYRLTISVGKNGLVNTVYNVGKLKKAEYPLSGSRAVPKNDTVGSASDTRVSQNSFGVNSYNMQNGGENSQFSFGRVNGQDINIPYEGGIKKTHPWTVEAIARRLPLPMSHQMCLLVVYVIQRKMSREILRRSFWEEPV